MGFSLLPASLFRHAAEHTGLWGGGVKPCDLPSWLVGWMNPVGPLRNPTRDLEILMKGYTSLDTAHHASCPSRSERKLTQNSNRKHIDPHTSDHGGQNSLKGLYIYCQILKKYFLCLDGRILAPWATLSYVQSWHGAILLGQKNGHSPQWRTDLISDFDQIWRLL